MHRLWRRLCTKQGKTMFARVTYGYVTNHPQINLLRPLRFGKTWGVWTAHLCALGVTWTWNHPQTHSRVQGLRPKRGCVRQHWLPRGLSCGCGRSTRAALAGGCVQGWVSTDRVRPEALLSCWEVSGHPGGGPPLVSSGRAGRFMQRPGERS